MFKIIILFLLRHGDSEEDIAALIGKGHSTVNRIKQGQVPRWDDGQTLIRRYGEIYDRMAAKHQPIMTPAFHKNPSSHAA